MKLTFLFSFLIFTGSWANSFSQASKLSLNLKNVTVQELIQQIEDQTKFYFLYQDEVFQQGQRVTIQVENESLESILKQFEEQASVNAEVTDHQIVLREQGADLNNFLQQQRRTVSGVVVGNDGNPIPGVTVVVMGTSSGTITNEDGEFRLEISANAETLQFSFVGMMTQEVPVAGKSEFQIRMTAETIGIGEVVAIGYGTLKKSDLTGAVSSVKSENFNRGVVNSPGQLLQGKVSGVNITSSSGAPGSGQRIVIRGQGSIRQGTGPLFVIDGFPVGLGGTGSGDSPLNFLNPNDIESIDVLKDASATAIYGSRGANGVILITTKSGQAGISKMTINSNFGISNLAKKIPVFSADEFRKQVVAVGGTLEDRGGNTDWQDELTRTAITNDQNLTFQGGTDRLTYRASLGYLDQEGIILNTGLKRYSGRVNATQKLLDGRLNIDFNLNTTIESGENANRDRLVSEMLDFNPTYPARDANGELSKYPDLMNPLIAAELYKDFRESRRIIVNVAPSFEIIKDLVYKLNFGYENRSSETDGQQAPNTDPFEQGRLDQYFSNGTNTLIENYLTYAITSGDHAINLLAGHSYQKTFDRWRHWSVDIFPDNGIEPRYNPGLGQDIDLVDNHPQGWTLENELQSFFGRVNYTHKDRYMVTATVRADGSSKFGANNKYGVFPSFAAGWRISEEDFMESSRINNLKLRAGWGQTGNQEIPSKITQALYTTRISNQDSYPLDNSGDYPAGTTFVRLANPDIQWEVSTQTNIGLDFGLFEGALSGTIDYFHKVSNNILLEVVPPDPIQPATTYWTNVEDMNITNEGLEIALDYQYRNEGGFSYSVGGNISFIDNVVEDSPFTILTTGSASGSGLTGATVNGLVNGYSIGSFYMKKFIGIGSDGLSQFEEPADPASDDRMVVGSALPDVLYNFYANLSYKRFDLSINFNGVSGNMIYDNTATNKFYKAKLANSLNATDAAIKYPEESIINSASVSTRYLKDGSFLRLNNMTLGYNFNTGAMGIRNWIREMRLSLTGQNLFVITDYDGFDPEVNQDRSIGGIQSFGIDLNGYPKARTFVVGLNVSF
ncbi:SusC/RagA family TonB-linked outer membrane protein [Sunxiuqinia sp. sy24]|uniref:SusC/RagA family TonB-linked outer membrane protein n=1 Tax=Sunxiuqinia sp. sy24 TaxID=3461495 RepID=UPI0040459C4C